MEQTTYLQLITTAHNIIKDFDITEEDKSTILCLVDAFLNKNYDQILDLLEQLDDSKKVDFLRTTLLVMEDLRLEAEDAIIKEDDLAQLEQLASLIETEDKSTAQALDKLLKEQEAQLSSGTKIQSP
jgi:hypothetical protein